jgi:hypothetical protein
VIVKLKNGMTLALDAAPPEFVPGGYFLLSGRPFDNPDLTVTPARFVLCQSLADQYEMRQYTIVLGASEDVVGDQAGVQGPLPGSPSEQ